MSEPNHFRRLLILWIAVSVVATPLVVLLAAPGLAPGDATSEASGQVTDNTVLLGIATPIAALILVYFAYSLIVFRHRGPESEEGVAIRGNNRVQITWIVVTAAIVLFAAVYGTVRLFSDSGAGGGQGQVQGRSDRRAARERGLLTVARVGVGGAPSTFVAPPTPTPSPTTEAPNLAPGTEHVVVKGESFSTIAKKYGLSSKAISDANPGVDNIAYAHPTETGSFDIRCAELCGLFHGHMFDTGQVVSDGQFAAWIHGQQREFAPATGNLKPYNNTYLPSPQRRAG